MADHPPLSAHSPWQRGYFVASRRRWLFFLLAAPLVMMWQFYLQHHAHLLDHEFTNKASTGAHREERFVYFLHHLNLYPVATTVVDAEDRPEAATALLLERGDTLLTEVNHTARYGEHLKTFILSLDAAWRGSTRNPSYTTVHGLVFQVALLALLAAFCWVAYPITGGLLVLLLGSNPYQLYEVYARENVHGWTITTAILLLALFVPVLQGRGGPPWYPRLAALVAGLLLGTVMHIRSEPVVIIVSCAVALLLMPQWSVWRKISLVGVLALTFVMTTTAWHTYFSWKIRESFTAVQAAGGVPYGGPREYTHQFWHPIHVGLGDFDYKYGIKWDDRWAARKIFPMLTQRYGTIIPPWDGRSYRFENVYHDVGQRYYKALLLIPGFYEVSRELFLEAITGDPLWYGKILLKRGWALLSQITPARVEMGWFRLEIPFHGLFVFPMLWFLWVRRGAFLLKVVLFTLPTCLPPFIIYSGRGMTFMAVYHLVVLAVGGTLLWAWGVGHYRGGGFLKSARVARVSAFFKFGIFGASPQTPPGLCSGPVGGDDPPRTPAPR